MISSIKRVVIDFKIIDEFNNECWHETFNGAFEVNADATIRDVQECALAEYMWKLKEETVKELHTKRRNDRW